MSTSAYDSYRPPEPVRGRRARRDGAGQQTGRIARRSGQRGSTEGNREMAMVPDVEFTSYYGRPVVKPPPWGDDVAAYLFLGGVAGGSGLLALGGQLTGRPALRRNARLGALGAVVIGGVALVRDLGRPERFLNMLRTFKVTSPMSVGSWILSAFGGGIGVAAASEVDRLTGERLPLGPLRRVLHAVEGPAGVEAAVFAGPLAAYTAVLLADTATPTWNEARHELPFVFVSSAALASGGLAMITTPVAETGPARAFALIGVAGDVVSMRTMKARMDPVAAEPLEHGTPGAMLDWSERLAIAGAVGTLFAGRSRIVAVVSGTALLTASALTRFATLHAGIASAKDPRYTIEPQKRRLAARRAAGVTHDAITTAG